MNSSKFFIGVASLSTIFLSACFSSKPAATSPLDLKADLPLERIPNTLSIEHFSKMKLEGRDLKLTKVLAEDSSYTRHAIEYQSNDLKITGILNVPKGEGPFPLIILNHGYINPRVYTSGRGLKREQDYLAKKGFAVLHTDYRGHAGSVESPDERGVYDAGLEYSMDSVNAILAVRQADLPSIDASKVGMLGHSLGGGVSLNIATAHPDLVKAFVLYAPVSADAWENFSRWHDMRDADDRTEEVLGTRKDNPDVWNALSSMHFLSRISSPILLFHGSRDADVPKEWSDQLAITLGRANKAMTYVEYEGEKHEFIREWQDFMEKTSDFFDKHLRSAS